MCRVTRCSHSFALAAALFVSPALYAAEAPSPPSVPGTVLARTGTIEVTVADYEAELTRLPEDARAGFGADPARVEALLNNLLHQRLLARQARERGIDKEDFVRRRVASETDKLYATELLARIDAAAGAQFDALPNVDRQARELYLLERDSLRVPEQVSITHIVFDTTRRTREDAMRLARETRARIVAGESMTLLARQLSDDPAARRTGGRVNGQARDALDPALAEAAFALRAVGDLSEPVAGAQGIYLVRLEEKRPGSTPTYEEARAGIVAKMRKAHVERRRGEEIARLLDVPDLYVNREAVDSLITRPGQEAPQVPPARARIPAAGS
jgi:parvulin-like peptidyl-prolyl isomerase